MQTFGVLEASSEFIHHVTSSETFEYFIGFEGFSTFTTNQVFWCIILRTMLVCLRNVVCCSSHSLVIHFCVMSSTGILKLDRDVYSIVNVIFFSGGNAMKTFQIKHKKSVRKNSLKNIKIYTACIKNQSA